MPKVSKESATHEQHGPVEAWSGEVDGYAIDFVSFAEDIDHAALFKGLPDDRCQCPHWGYVLKGSVTFRFADHDEVYQAGDAFYAPPGHVPADTAGCEYLEFSPADELKKTEAVLMKNMEQMQGG
jgi:hypothetical protein